MERNHYMVRIGQWKDMVWEYAMKGVVAVGCKKQALFSQGGRW
jgi:hypothetical protein